LVEKPQAGQRKGIGQLEEPFTNLGCNYAQEDAGRDAKSDREGFTEKLPSLEGNSDDEFLKYLDSFQTYAQQLFKSYADKPVLSIENSLTA